MESINELAAGFAYATTWNMLLFCFLGVTIGMFIGVLPGIGALSGVAIVLPLTYYAPAGESLVMLAGVYYGALYGGSTAAILLNLPGTPSAAVTCLDGYPMAQQGRAGLALFVTTITSFVGGCVAIVAMIVFSPPLAGLVRNFGSAEYFAMMLLGLIAASTVSVASPIKSIMMVVVGLIIGVVGTDVESGYARFTFGQLNLLDGVSLVALAMGLLGISEVFSRVAATYGGGVSKAMETIHPKNITFKAMLPSWAELRQILSPTARGSLIGTLFGALPGTGGPVASFLSYAVEKKSAADPSRFGKGAIEGVAAPEAANNAAAQAAFIPTLTLGIPGDAVMALMLGALMVHGIQPGPAMLTQHSDIFWGLIASFWIGNLMLLVLNIPLIKFWVMILAIPYKYLYPAILLFACVGVFSVNNSLFDVYVLVGAALFGYVISIFGFSGAPLLLGFILGPMIEVNMRRSLLISGGDFSIFLTRPVSAGFMACTIALLIYIIYSEFFRSKKRAV
jgi:putative tricarboxylic transport membrane protein